MKNLSQKRKLIIVLLVAFLTIGVVLAKKKGVSFVHREGRLNTREVNSR